MTKIFDGVTFANKKLAILKSKIFQSKIKPRLEIILVGNDPASVIYTNLKKKKGGQIDCVVNINQFPSTTSADKIIGLIKNFNQDPKVHGILVQLPLPQKLLDTKYQILNTIAPAKDVDGLSNNSSFTPATAKAILEILNQSLFTDHRSLITAVIGANGFIGQSIIKALQLAKVPKIIKVDINTKNFSQIKKADIVISATGQKHLINKDMIKKDSVLIDVGAPQPEFHPSCYPKAKFYTPVPGGIGPVTIACLFENLLQALYNQTRLKSHT